MNVDLLEAVIQFLKTQTEITDLAEDRIYGAELPQAVIENRAPQKICLVTETGGFDTDFYVRRTEANFSVFCFGETYHEAGKLDRAVAEALKLMDRVTTQNGALLHGATPSGGPTSVRDSDTNWPAKWRTLVVYASETAVIHRR